MTNVKNRVFVVFGLVLLLAAGLTGVGAAATIVVDGNLESDYGSFTGNAYTTDGGGAFNGLISVIEDTDAYYIGFQQSPDAKSNAYCANSGTPPECYQDFSKLEGSDHITFSWTIGQTTIEVPVDIISSGCATPSTYCGIAGGGDGGSISGIDPGGVEGKSAMDYNMNVLGWTDTDNSPNFAGQPGEPFLYGSIAEVSLTKSALAAALGTPDADGLDLTTADVNTHNSPGAPNEGEINRIVVLNCVGAASEANAGDNVAIDLQATTDGQPTAGAMILVLIDGPGSVVSVGGTAGNKGLTGIDGIAQVVVTSTVAGQSDVRGVWDLDNDSQWDQGTEPTTEPECPVTWLASETSFDFTIVKDVDKSTTVAGDTLTYEVTVTNTGPGTLTNLVITDEIPSGTTYVGGSASNGGTFDSGANNLTWNLGSLDPASAVSVTFQVTVNADAPATIVNVAVASTDQAGPKEDDATTTRTDVVGVTELAATGTGSAFMLVIAISLLGAGVVFIDRRLEGLGEPNGTSALRPI